MPGETEKDQGPRAYSRRKRAMLRVPRDSLRGVALGGLAGRLRRWGGAVGGIRSLATPKAHQATGVLACQLISHSRNKLN